MSTNESYSRPFNGKIYLTTGCMFSSKSSTLSARYIRYTYGNKKCIMIKYKYDTRYDNKKIVTHDGRYKIDALPCTYLYEVDDLIKYYDVICIDEIQFFKDAHIFCHKWANLGKIIEACCLNGKFNLEGWDVVSKLLPLVYDVTFKRAVCKETGEDGVYTERLINDDSDELIGGDDIYRAVDRKTYYRNGDLLHQLKYFKEFIDIYAEANGLDISSSIKECMVNHFKVLYSKMNGNVIYEEIVKSHAFGILAPLDSPSVNSLHSTCLTARSLRSANFVRETNFEKVKEFHKTFGLDVHNEPYKKVFDENPKLVKLRMSLIDEEVGELREALEDKNMTETLDASADTTYVVIGLCVSLGLGLDEVMDMVHKFNMINEPYMGVFDENPRLVKLKMSIIDEKVNQLREAMKNKNMIETLDASVGILYSVYELCISFRLDLNKAIDLVHKSNMSKVCLSEKEAIQTVEWYKKEYANGNHKYDSPAYRKASDDKYWIVYNKSTGKILKSINYKPVNFDSMLL